MIAILKFLTMDEAPVKDDNGIKIIYAPDWLLN